MSEHKINSTLLQEEQDKLKENKNKLIETIKKEKDELKKIKDCVYDNFIDICDSFIDATNKMNQTFLISDEDYYEKMFIGYLLMCLPKDNHQELDILCSTIDKERKNIYQYLEMVPGSMELDYYHHLSEEEVNELDEFLNDYDKGEKVDKNNPYYGHVSSLLKCFDKDFAQLFIAIAQEFFDESFLEQLATLEIILSTCEDHPGGKSFVDANGYTCTYSLDEETEIITNKLKQIKNECTALRYQYFSTLNKTIKRFENLIDKLQMTKNTNYIDIKDFYIKSFEQEDFYTELLVYIYEHNQKVFTKIYEENKNIDFGKLSELEELSIKYNLPFSFSEQLFQQSLNTEEVEKIIIFLKSKLPEILDDKELLEKILLNNTSLVLEDLVKICSDNAIPFNFLIEHSDVFFSQKIDGLRELFKRNVSIIKKCSYQISDLEIYLEDSHDLIKRIRLVEGLNINLRKNSNNNDQFLKDESTYDYFDMFIEQGYYKMIRNHLPYCNKDAITIIKRLNIASKIGLTVQEEKDFSKSILTGKGFVISNCKLDNYLNNYVSYAINGTYKKVLDENSNITFNLEDEDIKELDNNYMDSDQEYNINGIIISRFKVMRCLQTLKTIFKEADNKDLLFNAIIYNSILTVDKIAIIYETIYQQQYIRY